MRQMISPMNVMHTQEVLDYLGIKRTALYHKIVRRQFPMATGRDRQGKYWHVEVIRDYKEKMLAASQKSWKPTLTGI